MSSIQFFKVWDCSQTWCQSCYHHRVKFYYILLKKDFIILIHGTDLFWKYTILVIFHMLSFTGKAKSMCPNWDPCDCLVTSLFTIQLYLTILWKSANSGDRGFSHSCRLATAALFSHNLRVHQSGEQELRDSWEITHLLISLKPSQEANFSVLLRSSRV